MLFNQLEVTSRRLFLWQKDVEEQRKKVADMRIKNEALVYNILPPHVAKHFLGQHKKDEVITLHYLWFNSTLKNNTMRCKKLPTIASGRKNVVRPF